jgi:hypothetical protein
MKYATIFGGHAFATAGVETIVRQIGFLRSEYDENRQLPSGKTLPFAERLH